MRHYRCIYKKSKGLETLELIEQNVKVRQRSSEMIEYLDEDTVICTLDIQADNLDKAWNEAKQALFINWKIQL